MISLIIFFLIHTDICLNGSTQYGTKIPPKCSLDDLVDLVFSEDVDYSSDAEGSLDEDLTKTVPTVFRWENGGSEVFLSGSFTDWNTRIPMSSRYICLTMQWPVEWFSLFACNVNVQTSLTVFLTDQPKTDPYF